jgi:uncharacterized protein (TIGR02246 family)
MRLQTLLIVAFLCVSTQNIHAQSSPDETAIRTLLAQENEGWQMFNAEEVASKFTSDAIWQNPFGVRLHGKTEIHKFLGDLMSRPGYRAGKDTSSKKILDLRLTSATTAAVWSDESIEGLINDNSGNPMQPRHSYYLEFLSRKTASGRSVTSW